MTPSFTLEDKIISRNDSVSGTLLAEKGISLHVKREDLIHKHISGNKFRKLKYNVKAAQKEGHTKLLTFGGAFSNHIAATAAAGKLVGMQTVGVIRGEELGVNLEKTLLHNETLRYAVSQGMQLYFIDRASYREKESTEILTQLQNQFGTFYLIPEGGTNELAVQGCKEVLTAADADYDVICCSVGTGGTIAGIIETAFPHQKVLAFPALKGDFVEDMLLTHTTKKNYKVINRYHFGGYGKVTDELVTFINTFYKTYQIPLDPIYTGKMMFGIFDLIKTDYFNRNTRILAIHTGGIQGVAGINHRLRQKNSPQIKIC
ncbi:1-aminocyclopropane-1-carboxylate deaminase/D-cysteine desulfhydrase [Aquimarina intermedia]|uniref:1-aminocyclopropane-1-carboxylate deaminase n=1 Tax=Aquimarina intermedia TaxID=350814 RepID=A0A5S5CDE0_9FLAO|nr:pyridoxal-phosphate dependent enzyme [Aquimarina intermedia]TYP77395.1 1-aminocyclopropane-1-carboxylate deaminase [Aquimarina intermedia]